MSSLPSSTLAAVEQSEPAYQRVIDEICNLNWANLERWRMLSGLCGLTTISQCNFGSVSKLRAKCIPKMNDCCNLIDGERNTDNLSPWPGVGCGWRKNESRRVRCAGRLNSQKSRRSDGSVLSDIGNKYLKSVRAIDPKNQSIGSCHLRRRRARKSLSGDPHSTELERSASTGIQAFSGRAHPV